jgi:predicted RNase H-like nuclease (RuvC/YqgF family)
MSQNYTSEEIRELLLYVAQTQNENEELRAKLIAMDAMLKNEMAKNKSLKQMINQYIA